MKIPTIKKIEVTSFAWDVKGIVHKRAFHYDPDSTLTQHGTAVRITASNGATGEYAGIYGNIGAAKASAERYLGRSAFEREALYQENKRNPAMPTFDLALWDLAGRMADLPVHSLLGTWRTRVPAYASTIDGAVTGPLSTPESCADFAQECLELGFRGFKIHPMAWPDVRTHVQVVLAIGDRVGGKMDMMIDPYCLYPTFADALKVGRACDEAGFFWLEDPYSDGGMTAFSHAKLREMIQTPLLQGEQLPSIEQRIELVLAGATDFVRADVGKHGLTGTLKLAGAAATLGLDVEPHRCGPGELQFLAATKNANYYELVWVHPIMRDSEPPIYTNATISGLAAVDKDGMVAVPDAPGLGVEIDWDYISAHETGRFEASV